MRYSLRDVATDVVIPVTRARISRRPVYLPVRGRNYSGARRNLSVTLLTIQVIGCTVIIPLVSGR